MQKEPTLWTVLKRVHRDEAGAVSLETLLIVGAIALPILIFLLKVGWPRVKDYFNQGLQDLEDNRGAATT
jgi:Flp pilus assembly pilin Flp